MTWLEDAPPSLKQSVVLVACVLRATIKKRRQLFGAKIASGDLA